jgi:hypothetical protein
MSDDQAGPPPVAKHGDPVAVWWETCGHPLRNALCWVEKWRHEAREDDPREITYQEFAFRCARHLVFVGEAYVLADGLSEVIAEMGTEGLKRVISATETEKNFGPVPRLNYELACHIAQTNQRAGRDLHRSLVPFASTIATPVKRGRGRSLEDIHLFRTLAWWAVDRGVKLRLKPGKTRERSAQRPKKNKKTKSAIELTSECFQQSPVHWGSYDNVNEAWQAHRHKKQKSWMLKLKLNAPVYKRGCDNTEKGRCDDIEKGRCDKNEKGRFKHIDDLVAQLPKYPPA